jgi:hypothetical protein
VIDDDYYGTPTRPLDLAISWEEQAERAAWRQYDAAAECCAAKRVLGIGAPAIPFGLTPRTRALITADPNAFWARVDQLALAIGKEILGQAWP